MNGSSSKPIHCGGALIYKVHDYFQIVNNVINFYLLFAIL
ncbi:hypothetical protein LLB_0229 [Legionella longbeachae D-4968]|nr:hypothetical protein LLB_0229 [Legionella longbeachae D-4968]